MREITTMSFASRLILGIAIGCSFGAVQATTETLVIAYLHAPLILPPAHFFNARMYDGFVKLLTWIDSPAPTLSTLCSFIGPGFVAKLTIGAGLLLVNFGMGAATGAIAACMCALLPSAVRRDARRAASLILGILVATQVALHLWMWIANVHLPSDPDAGVVLRNAARNFLHDGTWVALLVLAVSVPLTWALVGFRSKRLR